METQQKQPEDLEAMIIETKGSFNSFKKKKVNRIQFSSN